MITLDADFRRRLLCGVVEELRLDFGCENDRAAGWTSLDINEEVQPDIVHDLCQPLPFLDNSVSAIYGRHVLEHLTLADGARLLRECCRVLKPGAPIRVAVPDLERFARNYVRGNHRFFSELYASEGGPSGVSMTESWQAALYGWGHRCAYDFALMREKMYAAGLVEVRRSEYRKSRFPEFQAANLDNRPLQSLFVEAIKPLPASHSRGLGCVRNTAGS